MSALRVIVTVDGPSGAGKSTVARGLARRLGYRYVDTGALYRALAWWVVKGQLDPCSEKDLAVACEGFPLAVRWNDDGSMGVWCGDEDISEAIRAEEIGMLASRISAQRVVRECLWKVQRDLGWQGQLVFEGRDLGSWVFPDAEYRFFVTASLDERARRRFRELRLLGEEVSLGAVREKMAQRDEQDSSRALAPLILPKGAVVIDTTDLSPEEVMDRMVQVVCGGGRGQADAIGEPSPAG